MEKNQPIVVKDAVYKLQLSLLEGINDENQLFAAGSLMSRSDYEDVVTERSIANLCGYPLCRNSLPYNRPQKGRYRISLKEHKVYDLHETYMYCSSSCVVNSRAFTGSLQEERCSVLNPVKLDEVLRLFGNLSLDSEEGLGKNGDLGLSGLKIQENSNGKVGGEMSFEQWVGPANAIEGYVPQRDHISKPSHSKNLKKGSKAKHEKPSRGKDFLSEMDFTSTIIIGDEYTVSKTPSDLRETASNTKSKEAKGKVSRKDSDDQFAELGTPSGPKQSDLARRSKELKGERSGTDTEDQFSALELPSNSNPCQSGLNTITMEAEEECTKKEGKLSGILMKSSLKSSGAKKLSRSVTWADEKIGGAGTTNLCEVREMKEMKGDPDTVENTDKGVNMLRVESAEACAIALGQAAKAVASGESDVSDAVSEAGIIILPHPQDVDKEEAIKDVDMLEAEPVPFKWPQKPGFSNSDLFDSEDSWYDAPPEGFSLTLSPFATMWMALFAWITSSSLAYIYGQDESFHEEYLSVNGREYPQKIVLYDGRSSEIKKTLAGCLARALPGLVADLRLPIPISVLEQGMGHLLDTMSFMDALPAFRMKQWQVIDLLFIDALSVCRIPALTPHMTNRRTLLHKVLDGAQISAEEYEVMKDLLIPLGRAPRFVAQSGA